MRISILLCCMLVVIQHGYCQSTTTYMASLTHKNMLLLAAAPHGPAEYNLHLADKKLKTSRRCIIAGAILTGAGTIMMIGGAAYALAPRPAPVVQPGQVEPHHGDATAPAIWICSIPLLAPGIPLLGIGLAQHKKWKHIKTDSTVETGIFNNGQVGLALNF